MAIVFHRGVTGPQLAAMRRLAGWTQKDLARRAGLHVQTVKYWERQPSSIGGHAPRLFIEQLAAKRITPASVASAVPALKTDEKQTCGAMTRKRFPCQLKPIAGNGRCKLHGGMSTGPKTPEGRQRISQAQRARWQAYRATPAAPVRGKFLSSISERLAGSTAGLGLFPGKAVSPLKTANEQQQTGKD